ncbi:MAG: ABC-type uncharacterized transport system substrate-binding protein [Thermoproteota archaeon]|jgi:ABC-type uncharacterized transport system substrate-binding protein
MKVFSLFFIFLYSMSIFAKSNSITIGILYPVNKEGSSYIGGESICISEGLIKEYKNKKLKVNFKIYDTEQAANQTFISVQKIIKDKVDVVLGTTYSTTAIIASRLLSK